MPEYLPEIQEQIKKEFNGNDESFLESIGLERRYDDDNYDYVGVDPNDFDDSMTKIQMKQQTLAKLICLFGPDFPKQDIIGFYSGSYYNG